MANKKNTKQSMDEIDALLAGLDNDDGLEFMEDKTEERQSVSKVAKDIKDGFLDSFTSDPKSKMVNFIDNAMPKSITREIDFIKNTTSDAMAAYEKSSKEIKSGVKSTIDIVKSKISQDSKLHKLLEKMSNKLDTGPKSFGYSKEVSEDDVIANTLNDLFAKGRQIDEITEKVKDVKENKKFETNLLHTNKMISSLDYLTKFHQEYTLTYYKKSIELKLKTLYVNKELLEVTKNSSEAAIRQFEAIVKNTSLPDLVKLRNTEQMEETLKGRMRENMADMFLAAMRPLDVFRKNISDKIGNSMQSISNGIATGLSTYDTISSTGEGIGKFAGGMAGDHLQNMVANTISQKLEDIPFIKRLLKKTKLFMADPTETFFDLAEKAENKNTVLSRRASRFFRELGFMAQTKSVENKRFVESAPDEATYFDYKTKNSIVKIIPTILGKIYGEVRGIRTGEDPVKIYYDYSTGKLEEATGFTKRLESKVNLALETNVKGEMDKFLSIIDKDRTFSDKTNKNVMSALIDHVSRGGAITPKALLKDTFLNKLKGKDRKQFESAISTVLDTNNNDVDAMTMEDLSNIMFSIKTNTPHIDSLIKEFYNNGQIEDVEAAGLVDYDEATGAWTVNKDKYAELIHKLITKPKNRSTGRAKLRGAETLRGLKKEVSEDDIRSAINDEIRNSTVYKNTMFKANRFRDRFNKKVFNKETNYSNLPVPYKENESVPSGTISNDVIYMGSGKKKEYLSNTRSLVPYGNRALVSAKASNDVTLNGNTKALVKAKMLNIVLGSDVVDAETMHKAYMESNLGLTYVTLQEWAESIGFEQRGNEFHKKPKDETKDNIRKGVLDHLLGYFKSFTGAFSKFKGVRDLFGIEPGMTPLMIAHKVITKTREWDKKIVQSIPRYIGKMIKGSWNLSGKIIKGGFGAINSPLTRNIFRVIAGREPTEDSKLNRVHEFVQKTRGLDENIAKKTPGKIWDSVSNVWKGTTKQTGKFKYGKAFWDTLNVIRGKAPSEGGYFTEPIFNFKTKTEKNKTQFEYMREKNKIVKYLWKKYRDEGIEKEPSDINAEAEEMMRKKYGEAYDGTQPASDLFNFDYKETNMYKKAKGRVDDIRNSEQFKKANDKYKDISNKVKDKVNEFKKTDVYKNASNKSELLRKFTSEKTDEFLNSNLYKENIEPNANKVKDSVVNSTIFTNMKKFFSTEKKAGDQDNDGVRDNSWEDRFAKMSKDGKVKALPYLEEKKEGGNSILNFLKDKLSLIGGILATGLSKIPLLKHLLKLKHLAGIVPAIIGLGTKLSGLLSGGWEIGKKVGSKLKSGAGKVAGFVASSLAAKNINTAKTVMSTSKALVTTGATSVASGTGVLAALKGFKELIIKKYGKKGGAKLLATLAGKMAVRAIPITGAALLAYDAANIAVDILKNGTSFLSAVSKQILGIDLFNNDEVALDEDGNPIKPDEEEFNKDTVKENPEDDPNLTEYVKEIMLTAKIEMEKGKDYKDLERRQKLSDMKQKYGFKDVDINRVYTKLKIEEIRKNKASATDEDIEKIKKATEERLKVIADNNAKYKQMGGYDNSKYGNGGGGIAAKKEQDAFMNNMLKGRQDAIDSKNSYVSTATDKITNIQIKGKEDILKMLDEVSLKTGVDATLLKQFAAIESGFNTNIKAKTSSATGLFQFTKSTWDAMLKKYGSKYDLSLDTPRENAYANALMGAEYVKENKALLSKIGRGNNVTDLYLAHFLGGGGARRLLSAPVNASTRDHVDSKSINSNQKVFFTNGRYKTTGELYDWADNLVKNKLKSFGITGSNSTPEIKDTPKEVPIEDKGTASENTTQPKVETNVIPETQVKTENTVNTENTIPYKENKSENYNLGFNTDAKTNNKGPVVETKSNNYMDSGVDNNILKESLSVQIRMEQHLKSIYDVLMGRSNIPGNSTNTPSPTPTPNVAPVMNFNESAIDIGKKRF